MTEADRLFARIAIKKNWVEPGQVEEARTYQEKLAGGPVGARLVMGLPDILERLGRLNKNQIAAVLKEMEANAFVCEQCGAKGYRLEFGDDPKKCEKCRSSTASAATVAGGPAPAPPVIQRTGPPLLLQSAKTAPIGGDTGATEAIPAAAPPPSVDHTKRRARAAMYDLGAGAAPAAAPTPAAGTGDAAASGPNRLGGGKPSGLSARPKTTENKTVDMSAEEIISATRTSVPMSKAPTDDAAKPPAAPASRSSGIVAEHNNDTDALLRRGDSAVNTPRTPPKGPAATGSMRMRAAPGTPAQDPWDPLESTCRHASLSIL